MLPASTARPEKDEPMPCVTSNRPRIDSEREGHGEPLVLSHGLTGSGARWRDTAYPTEIGDRRRLILMEEVAKLPAEWTVCPA